MAIPVWLFVGETSAGIKNRGKFNQVTAIDATLMIAKNFSNFTSSIIDFADVIPANTIAPDSQCSLLNQISARQRMFNNPLFELLQCALA